MKEHAILLGCAAIPIANCRSLEISKTTIGVICKKNIAIIWDDDKCAKLDVIFSSFSCNFRDNFVERGLLTMVISTKNWKNFCIYP